MNKKTIIVSLVIVFLASGWIYYFGLQLLNKFLTNAFNNGVSAVFVEAVKSGSVTQTFKDKDGKEMAVTLQAVQPKAEAGKSEVVKENTETINNLKK